MLPVAGEELAQRGGGVAGAQVEALARPVEEPPALGRGRAPPSPRAAAGAGAAGRARHGRSAAGRRPRRCWCRPASRRTRPAAGGCRAWPRGRDPAGGAVGGRTATVERGGELPGDERSLLLDREGPDRVDRAGLVDQQARLHVDATGPQRAPLPRWRPGWRRPGRTPRGVRRQRPAPRSTGPVRPVWLQGSSVTTAVVPAAAAPARASASASACGVPAPRWKPSATTRPSSASSTQPTRGLGPSGTPGLAASSRARSIAACSAGVKVIACSPVRRGLRGRRQGRRKSLVDVTCVRFPSGL